MDIIRDWAWDDLYQQSNNQLMVFDRVCNPTLCDELTNLFQNIPSDMEFEGETFPLPKDKSIKAFRYEYDDGVQVAIVDLDSAMADSITRKLDFCLPKGLFFGELDGIRFDKSIEGEMVNWSLNETFLVDEVCGTVIIYLNDDLVGGEYCVNGHTIPVRQGTVIGHNFNTNMFTCFNPILKGARNTLQLYFKLPKDIQEEVIKDEDRNIERDDTTHFVQSVPEGSQSD